MGTQIQLIRIHLKYQWKFLMSNLFGHNGKIGVGDKMPKGKTISDLDSPSIHIAKRYFRIRDKYTKEINEILDKKK